MRKKLKVFFENLAFKQKHFFFNSLNKRLNTN